VVPAFSLEDELAGLLSAILVVPQPTALVAVAVLVRVGVLVLVLVGTLPEL
jgi:hypothetical protein